MRNVYAADLLAMFTQSGTHKRTKGRWIAAEKKIKTIHIYKPNNLVIICTIILIVIIDNIKNDIIKYKHIHKNEQK